MICRPILHSRHGTTNHHRIPGAFLWIFHFIVSSWGTATAADIIPFQTFNQSPLVQIYGLPAVENGWTVTAGKTSVRLLADITSNFAMNKNSKEDISLDGETYRTTLALRYGVNDRIEAGLDVPWITHSGGFLDGFVSNFHEAFGLAAGGRDAVPKNRLLFTYSRDGKEQFTVDHSSTGIGDIRLTGGLQLYRDVESPRSAVALRALVKLPTGDSTDLHGSGSTDFSLWLSGADVYDVGIGEFGFFAAAGAVLVSKGDVLRDLQRPVVGFGTIGIGWSPIDWFAIKTQFYAHSPFYRKSSLHELGITALQWLSGFTFAFSDTTALDIGVSEDLALNATSPDVSFHFGLSTMF